MSFLNSTKMSKGILAPDYKVPSRNTVKSRIEMMYCDMKGEIYIGFKGSGSRIFNN
jgi:hypothetical protein